MSREELEQEVNNALEGEEANDAGLHNNEDTTDNRIPGGSQSGAEGLSTSDDLTNDNIQAQDDDRSEDAPQLGYVDNSSGGESPLADNSSNSEFGGLDSEEDKRPELGELGGEDDPIRDISSINDNIYGDEYIDSNNIPISDESALNDGSNNTENTPSGVLGDNPHFDDSNSLDSESLGGDVNEAGKPDGICETCGHEIKAEDLAPYKTLVEAAEFVSAEAHKIRAKINELEDRERARLGDDYQAFLLWCKRREKLEPDDDLFYAYEDAWKKALALIRPLRAYIENIIYNDVLFSAGLHYIIVDPFTFEKPNDEGGVDIVENPLYRKHNVASKAYLVSSASDEGSSSSVHITKSLQDGDFMMQDLLRTRYGTYVYSLLEQLDIGAVLL